MASTVPVEDIPRFILGTPDQFESYYSFSEASQESNIKIYLRSVGQDPTQENIDGAVKILKTIYDTGRVFGKVIDSSQQKYEKPEESFGKKGISYIKQEEAINKKAGSEKKESKVQGNESNCSREDCGRKIIDQKMCGICKRAFYCSENCLLLDFNNHRVTCI